MENLQQKNFGGFLREVFQNADLEELILKKLLLYGLLDKDDIEELTDEEAANLEIKLLQWRKIKTALGLPKEKTQTLIFSQLEQIKNNELTVDIFLSILFRSFERRTFLYDNFRDIGITRLEDFNELQDDDLQTMNIKPFEWRKIKKYISIFPPLKNNLQVNDDANISSSNINPTPQIDISQSNLDQINQSYKPYQKIQHQEESKVTDEFTNPQDEATIYEALQKTSTSDNPNQDERSKKYKQLESGCIQKPEENFKNDKEEGKMQNIKIEEEASRSNNEQLNFPLNDQIQIRPQPDEEVKINVINRFQDAIDKQNLDLLIDLLKDQDEEQYKKSLADLLRQNKEIFHTLVLQYQYFDKIEEYKQHKKLIEAYIKTKKYDRCNDILKKASIPCAYALYISLCSEILDIKDPCPNQFQDIQKSKTPLELLQEYKESCPVQCIEQYEYILIFCEGQDFELVSEQLIQIYEKSKETFNILANLVYQFSPVIEVDTKLGILSFELPIQQKDLFNNIFKHLKNEQYIEASIEIQNLLPNSKFIYEEIIKIKNDFTKYLSIQDIYKKLAPNNVRNDVVNVIELLDQDLKFIDTGIDQERSLRYQNLFKQIFYENEKYFDEFYERFFQSYKKFEQLERPISFQQLSINSLKEIFQMLQNLPSILNITDFMSVHGELDSNKAEEALSIKYSQTGILDNEELYILLFDYVKRRCSFTKLISTLSKYRKNSPLSRQILFNYLLKNSDKFLRILLYQACSNFMPVPLISYDWVNADERKLLIYKELFYIFEKYKSVFTFKLSTNKNKGPHGCTSLINSLFNKDFEKHYERMTNYGCIDIQFDYNFASPMLVPVADAHGILDLKILDQVYVLFDIFIIHVLNNQDDLNLLEQQIQIIKNINNQSLIIVIIHDSNIISQDYLYVFHEQFGVHSLKITNFDKLLEQGQQNLKDKIFEIVKPQIQKSDDFKGDYKTRLQSMRLYYNYLQNFQEGNYVISESLNLIEQFLYEVKLNINQLREDQFLPLNYIWESICEQQQQLLRESEIDTQKRDQLKAEIDEQQEQLSLKTESKIVEILKKIIDSQNFVGTVSILAKLLKGVLESVLEPLLSERTLLRSQLQIEKIPAEKKIDLQQQMKNKTEEIENKWFSVEFVIRELYFLSQKSKSQVECRRQYFELSELQISQGQPFEIIDGNNLLFISEIYDILYNNNDDQVLIVSVMGPQSSGKSLLLNFLFGTQFLSSAGRCTKGVYASLLTINNLKSQSKYKQILILDTEGIQAAEGRDDQFDKRIVFYIMCVSHVVLICNKGEMNKQMSEIIKLATDAISSLKENVIQAPSVNIVMNMLAEIKESVMEECIKGLTDAILEIEGEGERLNKIFKITKENVFILPYAFDRSGQGQMIANQPSQEFSKTLEPLRTKILHRALYFDPQQSSHYTLKEWFKFAYEFWVFTQTFKGITDFSNIDQKKQDQKVTDKISQLMEEHFDKKKEENNNQIMEMIKENLKLYEGAVAIKIDNISLELKSKINNKYQQIAHHVEEVEYRKFCGDENINHQLREKRKGLLNRQMSYYQTQWISFANEQIAVFSDKKSKIIGDARLQRYITEALQVKDGYTLEEAKNLFEKAWVEIENDVTQMLKVKTTVQEEVFQLIHSYYKNEIIDNQFDNIQEEKDLLRSYKEHFNETLKQQIIIQSQNFFYFIGNLMRPSVDKIISFQEKKKLYAVGIPNNMFKLKEITQYYYWQTLLIERFNFSRLTAELKEAILHTQSKYILLSERKTDYYRIQMIIKNMNDEIVDFNLELSNYFVMNLSNIDNILISFSHKKKEINNKNLDRLLQCYMDIIYQNITSYFQFSGKQFHKLKYMYNYIDLNNVRLPSSQNYTKYKRYNSQDYICSNEELKKDNIVFQHQEGVQMLNKSNIIVIIGQFYSVLKQNQQSYFSFLINPHKFPLNEKSQECQGSILYFFDKINWDKAISNIEKAVLRNYKKDGNDEGQTIKQWLETLKNKRNNENTNKFVPVSRKMIQSIATEVKSIITTIDEELEPFCFKISERGIHALHLIAQTFINALTETLVLRGENAPLEILQNSRSLQEKFFIAKLTSNDKEIDSALANKISEDIKNFVANKWKEQIKNDFGKKIKQLKQQFKKLSFVKKIEDFALLSASGQFQQQQEEEEQKLQQLNDEIHSSEEEDNVSFTKRAGGFKGGRQEYQKKDMYGSTIGPLKQRFGKIKKQISRISDIDFGVEENLEKELDLTLNQVIEFYVTPKELLIKKFDEQWKKNVEGLIITAQKDNEKSISEAYDKIINYFETILEIFQNREIKLISGDLFLRKSQLEALKTETLGNITDFLDQDLNYQKVLTQNAARVYLVQLIEKKWKNKNEIIVHGITLLKIEQINLPVPEDIPAMFSLDQSIVNIISDALNNERISKIDYFIEELVRLLNLLKDKVVDLQKDEIVGEHYQDLKNELIGCEEHCPLCRRQCDVPHQENEALPERMHQCIEGHQIQGFGGNRHFGSNNAVVISCNELKDSNEIVYKDETLKWVTFKDKFKKWDFSTSTKAKSTIIKEKNVKIWNYIGHKVCEYYQKEKKIDINFAMASMNYVSKIHYILLLDRSGSMAGSNWTNLINAVGSFLKQLEDNILLKRNSRVSIIGHDHASQKIVYSRIPEKKLVDKILFNSGDNDFDIPLKQAYYWLQKSQYQYDKQVLCFMSDGGWTYPDEAVKLIASDTKVMSKLEFVAIGYGSSNEIETILTRMAKELNGKVKTCIEPQELTSAFVKLIPNVYQS